MILGIAISMPIQVEPVVAHSNAKSAVQSPLLALQSTFVDRGRDKEAVSMTSCGTISRRPKVVDRGSARR
jgi:hypothetical protein